MATSTICIIFILMSDPLNCDAIKNITLEVSSIPLPVSLYGHISAVYDDKVHIIGGYTINSSNLTIPSNLTYSSTLNDTFDAHNTYPDFWVHPITCDHRGDQQCSFAINESLYIFQMDGTHYYIIVYDMNDYSYALASEYEDSPYEETKLIGCLVSDDEWIWWVPGVGVDLLSSDSSPHVSYNIKNNSWTNLIWDTLSSPRTGIGCCYYRLHIYMFGGQHPLYRNEAQYFEKCKMYSDPKLALLNPECNIILGSTAH
eukprot:757665_1